MNKMAASLIGLAALLASTSLGITRASSAETGKAWTAKVSYRCSRIRRWSGRVPS